MHLPDACHSPLPRVAAGVVVAALLFVGHAHPASSPDPAGKSNRLLEASGMAHAARQLPPAILSAFDVPHPGIPGNVRMALRTAAAQTFQADPMIERMRTRMDTALIARQLDDTLAWLDSPLGRRITAMEIEAAEPAAAGPMQSYARELEKRPPARHRADLIEELNRATGSSELNASIIEAVILATMLGFNAAQPVQDQVPADVFRQQVKAGAPQVRQQSDQMVVAGMHYTYRSLSDPELETYLQFLKSPSGAVYSKGAFAAFSDAMFEAIGRFMQAIPKALATQKGMTGT